LKGPLHDWLCRWSFWGPLRWLKRGAGRGRRALVATANRAIRLLRWALFPELHAIVERHAALLEEFEAALDEQEHHRLSVEARLAALEGLYEALRAGGRQPPRQAGPGGLPCAS
jgi:hypothetical protein